MTAAHRQLERDLRGVVSGGVAFDPVARAVYATDASIYRIAPLGVVFPRDAAEAQAAVQAAGAAGVSVVPRGGGTSLAGQCVGGGGLVIDLSRHMNQVFHLDADNRLARVGPGLVLDRLNAAVRSSGLMFGPDVATSSRACVGGMIGNNSCGARSVRYGKTIDHVLALDLVQADGRRIELAPRGSGREERVITELLGVAHRHADEVRRRFPDLLRRVSGYNLDALLGPAPNPAHVVVGSEGTLGLITEATVGLCDRPGATVLGLVAFDDLGRAMDAVPRILQTDPSAVELVDRLLLSLARSSVEYGPKTQVIPGDPQALLVVEYDGGDAEEAQAGLDRLRHAMAGLDEVGGVTEVIDPDGQADVWAVRKAGLGILMSVPGDAKPIAFVEDTAVPPERLGEFVRRFRAAIRDEGATAAFYGHASAGCLHIRPILDLGAPGQVDVMLRIMERTADLVLEFGGAMSGEHGDGRLRAPFLERFFGPELIGAFAEVKAIFDPDGRFNPGIIVDPAPLTEGLRERQRQPQDPGDASLLSLARRCNGNGACRKLTAGVMCPSYRATLDEVHSPRGRANALRAALVGEIEGLDPAHPDLYAAMDLCVGCKGCVRECPTAVDIPRMKAEVLNRWHAERGVPLRTSVFGRWPEWARLATALPGGRSLAALGASPSGTLRRIADRVLGLDPERSLPLLARRTLRQRFRPEGSDRPVVVLFDDTFTRYHEPEIGLAAARVLSAAGFEVMLPPAPTCCGRTYLSKGLLDRARVAAATSVATLHPLAEAGLTIVGLEPSCILTFRDEIPDLLDGDPRAARVAEATVTLGEFLQRHGDELPLVPAAGAALIHGHCHDKALVGMAPVTEVLRGVPGLRFDVADTSCCGMAGSFGYEAEHAQTSRAIAQTSFLPAITAAAGATLVMDGSSCRQQAMHLTGRRAIHLAELLSERLPPERRER